MSGTLALTLVCGAAVGVGLWMVLAAVAPSRPDLVAALTRPSLPTPAPPATTAAGRAVGPGAGAGAGVRVRLETGLSAVAWLRAPAGDLAVIGMSRGTFLLCRVTAALGALLLGPLYTVVFSLLGVGIPVVLPVLAGIVLAVVGWAWVRVWVHGRAQTRRRQMRYALVAYLQLVALYRAAGQAMGPALAKASQVSPTWPFRRIGAALAAAVRLGSNEWAGLAGLAAELGIDEMADLASIADTGAATGGGVYSTLMARAAALRRELQYGEQATANATTTKLAFPRALIFFAAIGFMLIPALATFLSGN